MNTAPSPSERADALEHRQMQELGERSDILRLTHPADIGKSAGCNSSEGV